MRLQLQSNTPTCVVDRACLLRGHEPARHLGGRQLDRIQRCCHSAASCVPSFAIKRLPAGPIRIALGVESYLGFKCPITQIGGAVRNQIPLLRPIGAQYGWRCFHCGEAIAIDIYELTAPINTSCSQYTFMASFMNMVLSSVDSGSETAFRKDRRKACAGGAPSRRTLMKATGSESATT